MREIARQLAFCAPQVDLNGKRVSPRPIIEYPLQWCVGNEAPIPIIFAVNLSGGKTGWQLAARNDMRRADAMSFGVEVHEISSAHIHRTDAQAHASGVDAIEVHEALERGLQRGYVIVADGIRTASSAPQARWRKPRGKEMRGTEEKDPKGTGLIDPAVDSLILDFERWDIWYA